MTQIFTSILRLYPAEYQEVFSKEIIAVLQEAQQESQRQGRAALLTLALRETLGLLAGASAQWLLKAVSGSAYLSQTRRTAVLPASDAAADRLSESEKRIEFLRQRMEHAIANHDFENARFYYREDLQERARLEQLKSSPA